VSKSHTFDNILEVLD